MLSPPRLPTRKKHGKELLIDCFNSHMVTLDQYLALLKQKALEKKIIDKIKEQKAKEREEKI